MTNLSRRTVCTLLGAGMVSGLGLRPGGLSADGTDRDAVMQMVDAAAAAISAYGFPAAVSKAPPNTWVRSSTGLYVFLIDAEGTLYLHPDTRMEGRNVAATVDTKGTPFIREIIRAAQAAPGKGVWTQYVWPDVKTRVPGTKHSYSKTAGSLIVSAGYVAEGS